jgi:hypothetical protein
MREKRTRIEITLAAQEGDRDRGQAIQTVPLVVTSGPVVIPTPKTSTLACRLIRNSTFETIRN